MIGQLTNARYSATQQICPKRWLAEALITPSHRNSYLSQAECYLTSTLKKKLLLLAVSFLLHQKLFFHQTFFDIWSRRHGIFASSKKMEKERERRKKKQPNYSARKVAQNDAQNRPKSCQKNVRNIKERKSYFCSQRRLPKVFFAFILLSRR